MSSNHLLVVSQTMWVDSNTQTLNYYHSFDKIRTYKLSELEIVENKDRIEFVKGSYKIIYKGEENDILRMKVKLRLNGVNIW